MTERINIAEIVVSAEEDFAADEKNGSISMAIYDNRYKCLVDLFRTWYSACAIDEKAKAE